MARAIAVFLKLRRGAVDIEDMTLPLGVGHPSLILGVDAGGCAVERIDRGNIREWISAHRTSIGAS